MPSRLPPSARARLERFAAGSVATSLLSVPSAVALDAVGLEPAGEVMGASVRQLNRWSTGVVKGPNSGTPQRSQVRLSSHPYSPYRSFVQTAAGGYAAALTRLLDEARAIGADGVVGIRLTRDRVQEVLHEFTATGTAVRARSRTRPSRPFTTSLAGTDVATLMLSGWVPVELHVAVEVGVRWNDYRTAAQVRNYRGSLNVEVEAYTQVVARTRASARDMLRRRIGACGADGGLLSDAELRMWDEGAAEVAEVVLSGTAVARFAGRRWAGPKTLTVVPLSTRAGRS